MSRAFVPLQGAAAIAFKYGQSSLHGNRRRRTQLTVSTKKRGTTRTPWVYFHGQGAIAWGKKGQLWRSSHRLPTTYNVACESGKRANREKAIAECQRCYGFADSRMAGEWLNEALWKMARLRLKGEDVRPRTAKAYAHLPCLGPSTAQRVAGIQPANQRETSHPRRFQCAQTLDVEVLYTSY